MNICWVSGVVKSYRVCYVFLIIFMPFLTFAEKVHKDIDISAYTSNIDKQIMHVNSYDFSVKKRNLEYIKKIISKLRKEKKNIKNIKLYLTKPKKEYHQTVKRKKESGKINNLKTVKESRKPTEKLKVNSIFIGKEKGAIINGQIVLVGDTIEGCVLEDVKRNGVVIKCKNNVYFNGVEK